MQNARILPALALAVAALVGCNGDQSIQLATFRATLTPVNGEVLNANPSGTSQILTRSDNIVNLNVNAAALSNVVHMQLVSTGNSCPTAADDTNGDGYIDFNEAEAAAGTPFLALDSSPASGTFDFSTFPSAAAYIYTESADLNGVVNAINAGGGLPIINPLVVGDSLNLGTRVVMVYGTSNPLPKSVGTVDDLTSNQSLPVLCGELQAIF